MASLGFTQVSKRGRGLFTVEETNARQCTPAPPRRLPVNPPPPPGSFVSNSSHHCPPSPRNNLEAP